MSQAQSPTSVTGENSGLLGSVGIGSTTFVEEENETTWQRLMRKYFLPTSETLLANSLKNLLGHHCKSQIEYKRAVIANGFAINYIEINNPKSLKRAATEAVFTNHPGFVADPKNTSGKKKTLVLMHGYAAGLGFFYENYDTFSEQFDRVLALDWPGMGGSSRKPVSEIRHITLESSNEFCAYDYAPKRSVMLGWLSLLPDAVKELLPMRVQVSLSVPPRSVSEKYANSEDDANPTSRYPARTNFDRSVGFFIDSLELFRQQELGSDSSFVLAGHSLGGLLSAQYAIKYPNAVDALILASPAGLNKQPPVETHASWSEIPRWYRFVKTVVEMNVTPQDFARWMGPRGPQIINSTLDRRFGNRWPPEVRGLLGDYLYHITVAPACGEFALHSILQFVMYRPSPEDAAVRTEFSRPDRNAPVVRGGVFAREPLFSSMSRLRTFKKPILILYGDTDWLRYPAVEADVKKWKDSHGVDASLAIIPNAGHHLYMDNAPEYHRVIVDWLKERKLSVDHATL
jgi:pimeloyl-ACP methyl ester carboxylesterase